ncbi:MAG: tRNA 2-thiocytidine biosynthesis protein TtcA, partial [Bacilli bacterium]|nr:tRNA 2-thiocytidine biosynthesis protein TtcA [Bacilli bacterium]
MLPKLKSDHPETKTLIRPLYLVNQSDINKWVKFNDLEFIDCACKVTKKKTDSKRREMKELIEKLKDNYEDVDKNIFKASENVNLATLLGYYDGEEKTSFLDRF